MEVSNGIFRPGREVDVEICQGGRCDSASTGVPPRRVDQYVVVDFQDFATNFENGQAGLIIRLRQDDVVIRTLRTSTILKRTYPNGHRCDGDGFLFGTAMRVLDAPDRSSPR